MNASQAWQAVIGQLEMDMPRATFDTWVKNTKFLSYEDNSFVIGVHNPYARDWLESQLTEQVTRSLGNILTDDVDVRFVIWKENALNNQSHESYRSRENNSSADVMGNPNGYNGTNGKSSSQIILNPKYTFKNFVVGAGNRLAHAASLAVAESPAKAYNPLFLYGGVGLGKTHLLQAIGNEANQRNLQVLYVSSEEFTNDLISAIRTHTTQAFREKYRRCDILLIDDIQFIAGKESTQEEFFHTFNTLHGQNKQLVISSDRSPKAMITLEERLRSRFEWGLIADIQAPDFETRLAILRSKAEKAGRRVPDEVLVEIAQAMQSNIRELEGALNRILAYADLRGLELGTDLICMALADMLPQRRNIDPQHVINVVAKTFGVDEDRIKARDRSRQVALPRQVVMYLLREEVQISLPQIGEALGGRDHTTVMYGCEKIAEKMESDDNLRRKIVEIREKLYGQV
ncbi:MAG: chromosomal replication initiator protein DnaA [Anaerolineales bacterium]|nr:chromosomal replication initiator protein DnaA [Anaerolineales bacterium]